MDDKNNQDKPVSRIIRERALAILRDTRSKIDPALLSVMKEKLTPAAMGVVPKPTAAPVSVPVSVSAPIDPASNTEPVDKQKIAAIVLEYMKNRDDKNKH